MVPPGGNDADVNAPYTVSSSDERIATATIDGVRITVHGVAIGKCSVTVTGSAGAYRVLPVQVYDHKFMDTGELIVTYTDAFEKIVDVPVVVYNDAELLIFEEVVGASLWRPVPPAGFQALGNFMVAGASSAERDPNGKKAVMVVKAKEGSDAIVLTQYYEVVHTVQWSRCARGARVWRPVCPTGWEPMGMVATAGVAGRPTAPPEYRTPCLRADLTIGGAADTAILQTSGQEVLGFWRVDLADVTSHAGAYLAPGTFALAQGTTAPAFDPVIRVLNVRLPMLGEAPPQDVVPKVTSFVQPQEIETPPRFARAMLVPCDLVNDQLRDVPWRVANSPFYRLERHVYYKLLRYVYNTTSVVQPYEVQITAGVTTGATETFRTSTNVTISAEAGIELKGIFSAKVTTTVSREFGYETQTSVEQLRQTTDVIPYYAAPGKATAVWQEWNRYVLYRHEGTALEAVAAWDFGINGYVTDEYPD
ncbi:MAG TPA: Vps62-related protein [Anaeromyxobacteraceae bacterium]|nr:Vps62-related protein [Anaeromyxobacteraceae bacterium]